MVILNHSFTLIIVPEGCKRYVLCTSVIYCVSNEVYFFGGGGWRGEENDAYVV